MEGIAKLIVFIIPYILLVIAGFAANYFNIPVQKDKSIPDYFLKKLLFFLPGKVHLKIFEINVIYLILMLVFPDVFNVRGLIQCVMITSFLIWMNLFRINAYEINSQLEEFFFYEDFRLKQDPGPKWRLDLSKERKKGIQEDTYYRDILDTISNNLEDGIGTIMEKIQNRNYPRGYSKWILGYLRLIQQSSPEEQRKILQQIANSKDPVYLVVKGSAVVEPYFQKLRRNLIDALFSWWVGSILIAILSWVYIGIEYGNLMGIFYWFYISEPGVVFEVILNTLLFACTILSGFFGLVSFLIAFWSVGGTQGVIKKLPNPVTENSEEIQFVSKISRMIVQNIVFVGILFGFSVIILVQDQFILLILLILNSLFIFIVFFINIYYPHEGIMACKNTWSAELNDQFFSENSVDKLYKIEKELTTVNEIREWPIDPPVFLKLISGALIPILTWVFKTFLSDTYGISLPFL